MTAIERLTGGSEPLADPCRDGVMRQSGVGCSGNLWGVGHVVLLGDRNEDPAPARRRTNA